MPDRWPRLTITLTGPNQPEVCRSCGEPADYLWQECDDRDKPEFRWFWLCDKCSDKIIEPHPRLYNDVHRHAPAPGAMLICSDCPHRVSADGTCGCPKAKANGGAGILIQAHGATTMFIDGRDSKGRRFGRRMTTYGMAPSACTGKNPTPFYPPIQ